MEIQTKVHSSSKGAVGIIELMGDVTSRAEESVLQAYDDLTAGGKKKILLKFNEASYINSSGIALIISLLSQADKSKQKVGACGLSNHFQKIFDMIGLTDYVTIFPSEEAALKGL